MAIPINEWSPSRNGSPQRIKTQTIFHLWINYINVRMNEQSIEHYRMFKLIMAADLLEMNAAKYVFCCIRFIIL